MTELKKETMTSTRIYAVWCHCGSEMIFSGSGGMDEFSKMNCRCSKCGNTITIGEELIVLGEFVKVSEMKQLLEDKIHKMRVERGKYIILEEKIKKKHGAYGFCYARIAEATRVKDEFSELLAKLDKKKEQEE